MDAYVIYQFGIGAFAVGCGLYGLALGWTGPLDQVALAAGVFAGLALGSAARWVQINRWWRYERTKARRTLHRGGKGA